MHLYIPDRSQSSTIQRKITDFIHTHASAEPCVCASALSVCTFEDGFAFCMIFSIFVRGGLGPHSLCFLYNCCCVFSWVGGFGVGVVGCWFVGLIRTCTCSHARTLTHSLCLSLSLSGLLCCAHLWTSRLSFCVCIALPVHQLTFDFPTGYSRLTTNFTTLSARLIVRL